MTRRQLLSLAIVPLVVKSVSARTGFHVTGRLVNDTSDLQQGYFALVGETGQAQAKDAVGISVHPDGPWNTHLGDLAGRTVQVSIFEP